MMAASVDPRGVPRLSRADIELKAQVVIEYFAPETLEKPALTPIWSFVEKSKAEFGLQFDASRTLGTSRNGGKILGEYVFRPRTIRIDQSLVDDVRLPFVLAHEFGHFVLHRRLQVNQEDYFGDRIRDTKRDLVTGRKILTTPRDWIEWQASFFAASVLVPRSTVRHAVMAAQREIGIAKNLGTIVLEAKPYSYRDFNAVRDQLCLLYQVSRTAIRNRLAGLGILIDLRDKNTRHISELLRED